jgi:hypothetical protein
MIAMMNTGLLNALHEVMRTIVCVVIAFTNQATHRENFLVQGFEEYARSVLMRVIILQHSFRN